MAEQRRQQKVKWGVLGAASIAVRKVIPAMQKGTWSEVAAIASRDLSKAKAAAGALRIEKAYGSYEELLSDPEIEAVYNPLPNHLHVPWSIKAAEAGKHVLCEKPIALNAPEARTLLAVRGRTGVKIGEDAPAVAAHERVDSRRADWGTARDCGGVQLLQPERRQRAA
jgi:predicted dehydrogenase